MAPIVIVRIWNGPPQVMAVVPIRKVEPPGDGRPRR